QRPAEHTPSAGAPCSIGFASAELAARLATALTPVALVKAALMSSMAFFIDAAANTVTVLSCACAGSAAMSANIKAMAAALSMAILLGRRCAEPGIGSDGSTCRNRRSGRWQRTH